MTFSLKRIMQLLCALALLAPSSYAELTSASREELLQRIKHLEQQNAQLAVEATRAKMQSEDFKKRYHDVAVKKEDVPQEDMTVVAKKLWKAEVSLGATASSGNNNSYQVNLASKGTRTTDLDELIFRLSADLAENEGEKISEKAKASSDYRRDIDKRWYWLLLGSLERDQLTDLDYRFTAGPGIGYRFWNTDKFKFSLETGPAFVLEKNKNDGADYSVRERTGTRLEYQLTDWAKLFQTNEILNNFQDPEDYVVTNELGVESSLTKVLSLRVFGSHRYDNQPAVDKKEHDFSLISALVYKFE